MCLHSCKQTEETQGKESCIQVSENRQDEDNVPPVLPVPAAVVPLLTETALGDIVNH